MMFGLAGLTIAMRQPELWASSEVGVQVYSFGTRVAGPLQIVLAAVAVFAYAVAKLGWRRLLTFFVIATSLSLASELVGTGTGWPFGNYSYTSGLGYKILGQVPFTIPLSWFSMGLVSYLIGAHLLQQVRGRAGSLVRLGAGVWLLVVWDLVLDPAMAHEALSARFWIWHETGPYHGMPLQNFAGWAITGLAFMGLARWLWRADPELPGRPLFPVLVYQVNMLFAMVLCASVGLWSAILLGLVAGSLPALGALVGWQPRRPKTTAVRPVYRLVDEFLRWGARTLLRGWRVSVEGLEHLPAAGPVILAARHEHHLYDACALLTVSPRPLRFLVALDWTRSGLQRRVMEALCRLAGWPIILRPQRFELPKPPVAYRKKEVPQYLMSGLREAIARAAGSEALVVFPEGFPSIDPHIPAARAYLGSTFYPGAVWIARYAARRSGRAVPIVPVGLRYGGPGEHSLTVRFGRPILVSEVADLPRLLAAIEAEVAALSAEWPEAASVPAGVREG
jgi:putative membrane protein